MRGGVVSVQVGDGSQRTVRASRGVRVRFSEGRCSGLARDSGTVIVNRVFHVVVSLAGGVPNAPTLTLEPARDHFPYVHRPGLLRNRKQALGLSATQPGQVVSSSSSL